MTAPLDGVTVIDLARALAGPHAGMMLGDLGARVIKVESPGHGDDARAWGPPFVAGEDGEDVSTYFLSCNRNKESITLDLKSEHGRQTLARLATHADVLVENFRPGVLDRLGFPVERLHELNPGLVILSISGFGHDGPEGGRAGYDQIAQGEAGLMSLTGPDQDHPTRAGVPIADLLAGMYGAFGIVAALHERNATGKGRVVRTSLLAALVGVHAFQGTRYTVAGEVPRAQGNQHPSISPDGLFRCDDGMLQIAVGSENLWQKFTSAFGLDGDAAGMATNPERVLLDAPTVCVLLGQGTGGGALALLPADRVICAQHSWLAPLPPEGASAILYRDVEHASQLADAQGVRSLDLLREGIVDRIVAEHPDAADEPHDFCRRLSQVLQHELGLLLREDPARRRESRLKRYRTLG